MTGSLVSPVLVGRRAESQALAAALERALAGRPATVLVGGEAGVGKSRLVGELVERARAAGVRALVGGCVELDGGGIAFGPVVDMLRALARDTPADELDRLLGPARAVVGRLVPELGAPEPAREGDREPARILELLVGVISRLAGERPLMLAFEDVQWADRATLDLIALLVAGASARPLLLAATVRSDELHRSHPFRRMAARWEQQRAVERLELDRLDARDVAVQIEAILGERPGGELVNLVFERSEGIPLFVEELLGAMRGGGMDHDYLPPSLRDVLLARAERLGEDGRAVLRVASAAARWAPEPLLARVAGLPAPALYAALRETVEQQLLVVDPAGRGYGFRHALARAAIHEDLLPGERALLHRAYAEALEADPGLAGPGVDVPSMLAHHWLAAHDLPRALSAAVRAGNAAAGTSPAAAQRHFELALELWSEVPDAAERAGADHAGLLAAAADAAHLTGGADRSLALVEQALAELDPRAGERRAMALSRRAAALVDLGREDEALDALEAAAAAVSSDAPTRAAANVLSTLAWGMARVDRIQRAGELGRRAIEMARSVGAREAEVDALITVCTAMIYAGDVDGGLARAREATAAALELGVPRLVGRAYVNRADALLMLGRYDEVLRVTEEGREAAERFGFVRTIGAFLRGNRAEALLRLGRWDEAVAAAAPGAEPPGVYTVVLLVVRAEAFMLSGRRAEAESDLREARRHLAHSSALQFAMPLAWLEAQLARGAGDLAGARALVARELAREDAGQEPRYKWPLLSLAMAVEADRALDARDRGAAAPEDAVERAAALRAEAEAMSASTPLDHAELALLRAEHARVAGAGEPAAWRAAVDAWRRTGEPYPLARALFRYAEALGSGPSAAAAAQEAAALAGALGAAPLLAEVEALIRRGRLSAAPGADTPPADAPDLGLTARELEVLRLVADGHSNGEIAQRLFISPKTASVHVSNILGKLGVATRVQAAAVAHRQGLTRV